MQYKQILIKEFLINSGIALFVIIAMLIFKPAEASEQDKYNHFLGSASIAYVASDYYEDVYSPFALSLGMGIAKELVDPVFNRDDISANAIGAIFGTIAGNQDKILPSWNTTDKILMQSYVWMNALDIIQTRKALAIGGIERNPLFGTHPSSTVLVAGKIAGTGIIYWIADTFEESRTAALWTANIIQFAVVRHNYFEVGF